MLRALQFAQPVRENVRDGREQSKADQEARTRTQYFPIRVGVYYYLLVRLASCVSCIDMPPLGRMDRGKERISSLYDDVKSRKCSAFRFVCEDVAVDVCNDEWICAMTSGFVMMRFVDDGMSDEWIVEK